MSVSIYLPISEVVIKMYEKLTASDKKNMAALYESTFSKHKQNMQRILTQSETYTPTLEERKFITDQVVERFTAATRQDYLMPLLDTEIVQLALQ